jgi:hypothetical protein
LIGYKSFLETQALMAGFTQKQIDRDLKRLEEAKSDFLKVEKDKRLQNEITIKTIESQNKIFLNSRNKKKKKADNDLSKQEQKERKEREKKDLEYQKLTNEFIKDLTYLRLPNISDNNQRELALLKDKFRREREAIVKKYGEETELEKQLLIQQKRELNELELEFKKRQIDAEKALRDAEKEVLDAEHEQDKIKFDEKIQQAENYIDRANGALGIATEINNLLKVMSDEKISNNEKQRDDEISDIEKQKQKELNVEGLSARQKSLIEKKFAEQTFKVKKEVAVENDKIAEKQFKRDKKLRLASVALDTAAAIVKAIAIFGPPPSPMGIAGITAAAVIGGVQAVIIAKQNFQGSASSISPPNISIPSTNNNLGGGNNNNNGGSKIDLSGTDTGNIPDTNIKISIVEIETVQNQIQQIEEVSTL